MKLFNRGRFEPNTGAPRARMSLTGLIVLLLLVIVGTAITYASYVSTASGTATATVAKFGATATVSDISSTTAFKGGTNNPSCTVTFKDTGSDVALTHKIEVTGVPAGVTVQIKDGESKTPNTSGTVTFEMGTFAKGTTKAYELQFAAGAAAEEVANASITVTATIEQAEG